MRNHGSLSFRCTNTWALHKFICLTFCICYRIDGTFELDHGAFKSCSAIDGCVR